MKILNGSTNYPFSVRIHTSHKIRNLLCEEFIDRKDSTMILTKQPLKDLLKYAEEKIDVTSTEELLHKRLKCLLVDNEVHSNQYLIDDAFTLFLNLCHIKKV